MCVKVFGRCLDLSLEIDGAIPFNQHCGGLQNSKDHYSLGSI